MNGDTMNSDQVAQYLNIPLVAVGQIVFDGRLVMKSFDQFQRSDVEQLSNKSQQYIDSLR